MPDLYPVPDIYNEGFLPVSDVHTLYYMQVGNPQGKPVIYLHGGPGGAISTDAAQVFDPEVYRVILFAQRGTGKSTPTADLTDNTTWHLVDDIEKLRKHLGIAKWMVYGGSWGSTLALAYSETHPEPCTALVLRGIFFGRKWELEWFTGPTGIASFFPYEYDRLLSLVPADKRDNVEAHYHSMIESPDDSISLPAAQEWSRWESAVSRLIPSEEHIGRSDSDLKWAREIARIELHYFVNKLFMPENHLLQEDQIKKIRHLPCIVVHGRYDVLCPPRNAYDLKAAYGEKLDLRFTPDAGHSAKDPSNELALKKACDDMASVA